MVHLPFWIRNKSGVAFSDFPERLGGRMPDFCIIGAAKCGTTALNRMLSQQPSFYMSPIKEPHYFSTEFMLEKGQDWYRGLFSEAEPYQVCGESSTSYTRYPIVEGTAARMADANPDMKLIYIMREPVSRTESETLQTMKYAKNVLGEDHSTMPLDDFFYMIEEPNHPYYSAIFETSCYIKQIEAFMEYFEAENMLLLLQEDLKSSTISVLERVANFLGVDPTTLIESNVSRNVTSDWIGGLERERAATGFSNLPFYNALKPFVSLKLKTRLLKIAGNRTNLSGDLRFSLKLREELREKFRCPNRRLRARLETVPENWWL